MKKNKIFTILCMFIIVILVFLFSTQKKETTIKDKPFKSIDINLGEKAYCYNSYLYLYGKNGIKIFKEDQLLFEDSFSSEVPFVMTAYDKIAVGEKNGGTIRIYSNQGHMYTLNITNHILGFSINKNGFCAVIVKNGETYQIDVYNNIGDSIYSVKDISPTEGIPISVAISSDNKVVAVSYAKINDAVISSNIILYSINDNQIFGGFIKHNQIVGIMEFLNDNNLVVISDKELSNIKININQNPPTAKEIHKKTFENIVNSVKFLNNENFLIYYGSPSTNFDGTDNSFKENTVVFYNYSGGKIGEYSVNSKNASLISANKFGAILSEGRLFFAINENGKKLWEYQATQDIKDVILYDNNKAIIVTNSEIKIVKIDKKLFDKQINNISNSSKEKEDSIENFDKEAEETFSEETTVTSTKSNSLNFKNKGNAQGFNY